MLIGIISDTHDNASNLRKVVRIFNEKKVELVFHAGDWVSPFMPDFALDLKCKIISVFGNNEGDKYRFLTRQKKENWNIDFVGNCYETELDGKKIVLYHGSEQPLTDALIGCQKYDLVITGHSHDALIEAKGKTLHLNPGSISGLSGPNSGQPTTIAIYNTMDHQAEILDIGE